MTNHTVQADKSIEQVKNLIDEGYKLRVSNLRESIAITERACQLSQEISFQDGIAECQCKLGLYHMILGHKEQAIEYAEKAMAYWEKQGFKKGIATAQFTIGSAYYRTDNYHIGLNYLLKCQKLANEIGDKLLEAKAFKAMGAIHEFFNDYETAYSVYQKCIVLSKEVGDKNMESNACNPLSGLYLKRDEFDKAFEVINQSIALKEETGDTRGLAYAYHGKGKIHARLEQYTEAVDYLQKGVEIQHEVGERVGEGLSRVKLGSIFRLQGEYDSARLHLQRALELGKEAKSNLLNYKAYNELYQIAKLENNTEESLYNLEQFHHYKENVINSETNNIVDSLKAAHQIDLLEKEANIQKEKNKAIQQKNEELDTFFYKVSHDLRGPISSLMGLYNVVKMEVDDAKSLQYFDMYQKQIQRLNHIILDLINLATMKEKDMIKSKIDFKPLIDECLESYSYLPEFSKIKFNIDVEPDLHLLSDVAILNSVLQNLIENSIKYSSHKEQPEISITIKTIGEEQLSISVADNGSGIPEEYQDKIFDMFFRANHTSEGTGLGLYIFKNAVEKLNGTVEVQSTPSEGSTFLVTLPTTS